MAGKIKVAQDLFFQGKVRLVDCRKKSAGVWSHVVHVLYLPRGALRLRSSSFQYFCRSCLLTFRARLSSTDRGSSSSLAACCSTTSSATCGFVGSEASTCWGSGVPDADLSVGSGESRFLVLWRVAGVVEGLVTRDWLPNERVDCAPAPAARRRGGGGGMAIVSSAMAVEIEVVSVAEVGEVGWWTGRCHCGWCCQVQPKS